MYKKLFFSLVISSAIALPLLAQNATDALRFSFLLPYGTARYNGVAGTFGALGNDISGIHDNPAGIGVYRMDETTFSFGFLFSNVNATFEGVSTPSSYDRLLLGNLGLVRRIESKKQTKNKQVFGLTFNRLANLNSDHQIDGVHSSSIGQVWFDRAQGKTDAQLFNSDPYLYYVAFFPYLIDYTDQNTKVIDKLWAYGDNIIHRHRRQTQGTISELAFTYGGNYVNKLQWGVQIGIPFINYQEEVFYTESNYDISSILRSYQLREFLNLTGTGINIKAGVIYRIEQNIRVSAALHTPTLYSIRGNFEVAPSSRTFDNVEHRPNPLVDDNIRFQLTTPLRVQLGGAYIFDNVGLISAEYHLTDFSANRLRSSLYSLSEDNRQIRELYQVSHQFRLGTEWRIEKLSVRGGYSLVTSPLARDSKSGRYNGIHTGFGFRGNEFQADVSYTLFLNTQEFYMYDAAYVPAAILKNNRNILMLTLIFRGF